MATDTAGNAEIDPFECIINPKSPPSFEMLCREFAERLYVADPNDLSKLDALVYGFISNFVSDDAKATFDGAKKCSWASMLGAAWYGCWTVAKLYVSMLLIEMSVFLHSNPV